MLSKKDLINHEVFSKYENNTYFTGDWEYALTFEPNGVHLRDCCEVNGIGDTIKIITSLEDLNETIILLNI